MENKAYPYLRAKGYEDRIIELDTSSATVALAAQALGCEEQEIAKTLAFYAPDPVLIVASGDARVDNRKFRDTFGVKAKMIPHEEVEEAVGFPGGGVCPFGQKEGVKVFLDCSLKKLNISSTDDSSSEGDSGSSSDSASSEDSSAAEDSSGGTGASDASTDSGSEEPGEDASAEDSGSTNTSEESSKEDSSDAASTGSSTDNEEASDAASAASGG